MDIKLNVVSMRWPGAAFNSLAALQANAAECDAIEGAIADYAKDRCEESLWERLSGQGWEDDDIQWCIDHPDRRPRIGYVMLSPG